MSIIYMQMWLLRKDFPRDPWLSFPASSESDCPSAWRVPLLGCPQKCCLVRSHFTAFGYPCTGATELKKCCHFIAEFHGASVRLWHAYVLGTNSLKTFWRRDNSPLFLPSRGGHSGLSGNSLALPPSWSGRSELLSKAVGVAHVCR